MRLLFSDQKIFQVEDTNSTVEHLTDIELPMDTNLIQVNEDNVTVIWFDPIMSTIDDTEKIKKELWAVNHTVLFPNNVDSCITDIKSKKMGKILLIISRNNAFKLLPKMNDLLQLDSIFIFPENRVESNHFHDDYPKVVDILDNANDLLVSITEIITQNNWQLKILSSRDQHQQGIHSLSDQSADFLWFQLFKVVIECLPHDNRSKEEMLTACRQKYSSNERMLKNIEEFDQTYRIDECIRWYTKDTFLYKMINEALRTEDIQQLCTFRYYIADLSNQLAQNYQILKSKYEKKFCLYRGVPLRKKEMEIFKASTGQLIAINSYWSTSLDRGYAMSFANRLSDYHDAVPVLFEINCDLHECNDSVIFADISGLSEFQTEQEFLFDAGSIFRIDDIKEEKSDNGLLYSIQITISGEGRETAKKYIEEIQAEMEYESPRMMLGVLLKRAGKYKESLQYYEQLLEKPGEEKMSHIYNRIGIALKVERNYKLALKHFNKAYDLISKSDPSERVYRALIRHNQGQIYVKQNNSTKGLRFYEEAVHIVKSALSNRNRYIAEFYASIGRIYSSRKEFVEAMYYQQEALEIRKSCFSPEDVILASSYDDIANVHSCLNNYTEALEFYRRALELRQKYLSPDHHTTAWSLHCVAKTYHSMGNSKAALDYYSKALEITKKCPSPSRHYFIAKTLDNILSICDTTPKNHSTID